MNQHRYILDPKGRKHTCISCGQKRAVRYIDKQTSQYLPDHYSRCDREINCTYHLNPYKDGFVKALEENGDLKRFLFPRTKGKETGNAKRQDLIKPSFTDKTVFIQTLTNYQSNSFCSFLINLFGSELTTTLVSKYFVGTSDHWPNSTIFWQIDTKGKIRGGKVMLYNPETGKRIKAPFNHISWVHSTLKDENYKLQQCLFGEHLLKTDPHKPVALVESEKTAIIASPYLPEFIWLATGGLSNFTLEKCKVLAGRNVALYPDLNAYDKWNNKALEFAHLAKFKISDFLETTATEEERCQGLDLADYLIRYDYNEYQFIQEYPSTIKQAA
ncbi:DUF6371 domain-containing protein [Adhaeribacter pallidiroseus]|uniref:Type I site-specific deoxyribonuclease n=1 Tax=Adhaeribacter pallidiroseus TaxID=2072847 RepID=A0A369QLT8_9BACT|nr:DUF6371 domain-containing protein [Adhaeribacter pallidiroseus]RDC64615.1 Type I site-specific deoxyribonuclease [Adhaeribacter pallidiroseus]